MAGSVSAGLSSSSMLPLRNPNTSWAHPNARAKRWPKSLSGLSSHRAAGLRQPGQGQTDVSRPLGIGAKARCSGSVVARKRSHGRHRISDWHREDVGYHISRTSSRHLLVESRHRRPRAAEQHRHRVEAESVCEMAGNWHSPLPFRRKARWADELFVRGKDGCHDRCLPVEIGVEGQPRMDLSLLPITPV